jgi:hypothetical protein
LRPTGEPASRHCPEATADRDRNVRPWCHVNDSTSVVVGTRGVPRSLVSIIRINTVVAMPPTNRESITSPDRERLECSLSKKA